jgi:hypothetical protein
MAVRIGDIGYVGEGKFRGVFKLQCSIHFLPVMRPMKGFIYRDPMKGRALMLLAAWGISDEGRMLRKREALSPFQV